MIGIILCSLSSVGMLVPTFLPTSSLHWLGGPSSAPLPKLENIEIKVGCTHIHYIVLYGLKTNYETSLGLTA